MNTRQDPIAVFDSGLGGISVLRHLREVLPQERFICFGDSANAPYGVKTKDEVRELTISACEKLIDRSIKALVIACNTATAAAVDDLRKMHPDMIIIGIEPALKPAADRFPGGGIGVMATQVTLQEAKFAALLARCANTSRVYHIPAPDLVPLVEAGKGDTAECVEAVRHILSPYLGKLDALVLGCTHYPFTLPSIRKVIGDSVAVYDGGEGTARETKRRLQEADLLGEGPGDILLENSLASPEMLARARFLLEVTL